MELDIDTKREAVASRELLQADVLGTVSHELRGPLTAIKGYATTLLHHERHLGREERRQFLEAITEASDRLEVIIERLLEVSELETGQLTLQLSPVDMAYLVGEALIAIEERVESKAPGRFSFKLLLQQADGTLARSIPLVLADPRRLREVLDNLLDNAIQYSPEGGTISVVIRPVIRIVPVGVDGSEAQTVSQQTVDIPTTPALQNMLEICVCDEGQGIPADQLERIFNRFHRVDTRLIREANGLGLGLTICKYLIELHHGLIWAENKPGDHGSIFHIRIPVSDEMSVR
jgi:two-component system phosphate regulon sensor histidine kinase PhoR